jgi:regulatory protein YycI of two-component signal transduction system YycFG
MAKKQIQIRSTEAQKSYLDDLKETVQMPQEAHVEIKKRFVISVGLDQELNKDLEDFIYKKRIGGEIYYTKTDAIKEALASFLSQSKI